MRQSLQEPFVPSFVSGSVVVTVGSHADTSAMGLFETFLDPIKMKPLLYGLFARYLYLGTMEDLVFTTKVPKY